MDAIGKSIALVWQLMLTIGIDYWALREALACVRTLTSDFGVERLLADIPDFLPDMFEFCGALPRNARDDYRRFLFPRCLSIAGWRHMCDGWIQRGCNSLRWFPKWIAELKNILSFLRSEPILEDLCRSLKARGMQGLAAGRYLANNEETVICPMALGQTACMLHFDWQIFRVAPRSVRPEGFPWHARWSSLGTGVRCFCRPVVACKVEVPYLGIRLGWRDSRVDRRVRLPRACGIVCCTQPGGV